MNASLLHEDTTEMAKNKYINKCKYIYPNFRKNLSQRYIFGNNQCKWIMKCIDDYKMVKGKYKTT